MTIEELIRKTSGESLPVSDDKSSKELKSLNKNIKDLVNAVTKSQEQDPSGRFSSRMKEMIDKIATSQQAKSIRPAAPPSILTKNITKKNEKQTDTVTSKLIETQRKDSTTLVDEIRKMRGELSKLKDAFIKPSQQPKMLAGGIDPNKTAVERDIEARRSMGREGGRGGGGLLETIGGLLGGLTGAALAGLLPSADQIKELAGSIGNRMFDFAKSKINEMVDDPKKFFSDAGNVAMVGAAALGTAYAGSKVLKGVKAAGAAGSRVGQAIAGGLGAGTWEDTKGNKYKEKPKPTQQRPAAQKPGLVPQKPDARKEPGLGKSDTKPEMRKEPTLGKTEQKIDTRKEPKIEAKPQPTQKIEPQKTTETPEQKEARERATQKAKDDARAMGDEDTAKRKRKVTPSDIERKKKPGFLDKLKTTAGKYGDEALKVGKRAGKGLLKAARVAGPVGAVIGAGLTVAETAQAASNAEEVLGIEGRKASFGERVAAGVGGLTESVTFGLVKKEDVAKKLAGDEKTGAQKVSGDKKKVSQKQVSEALDQKAKDAKTEKDLNKKISGLKIEMQKLLNRGRKEEAMEKAREVVDLQTELRKVRGMAPEQKAYQPAPMLKQASQENRELTLPSPNVGPSPFSGMMQNIQNVFNSSNQTVVSGGQASPRNDSNSVSRYLERIFS